MKENTQDIILKILEENKELRSELIEVLKNQNELENKNNNMLIYIEELKEAIIMAKNDTAKMKENVKRYKNRVKVLEEQKEKLIDRNNKLKKQVQERFIYKMAKKVRRK